MANTTVSRRQALVGVGVGAVSGRQLREAGAQGQSGYKRLVDRIEGYELQYPADWLKVNVRTAPLYLDLACSGASAPAHL